MAGTKEKKSFKKYASKHLAGVIETRRKTANARKEKKERLERRRQREARDTAKEEQEHIDQLERLKDTDPEFFSYLEEEDPTLLQFGKDEVDLVDGEEGSDAETDVDEEEEETAETEGRGGAGASVTDAASRITRAELQRRIESHDAAACIDLFVSAVRELGYPLREPPRPASSRKFEDPSLVKETLVRVAQSIGGGLSTFVSGKGAFKSHKTRYLVKRLLVALTAVLGEGPVDAALTAGLLHALTPFVPILHYVKGITKGVLKVALPLCTASEEPVRVAAYVVVRTIATRATGTRSMYQSTAFKGIFLALVRTAHQYNAHNQPTVAFLMNCVVDLYGTDMEAAYQHTFVYLRQLAIYLRAALLQQTQSNVRAVVNWQYLNALRTWGAVVSTYSNAAQLGPLIHPLVQIAMGLMDLFASPRMFPMHLQLIEILNHVSSRAEGMYIPVSPYLLRILTSPSMALSAAPATSASGEPVELPFTIRVKKAQARSRAYHQSVWMEALYLLTEHLALHSHTVGFPEAFWAVESTLKKLRTEVKVPRLHSQMGALIRHMQTTTQRTVAKRDQAHFGPCDLAAVKQLEDELRSAGNPLVSYHQQLRRQRVEAFAARQKGVDRERVTLESTVQSRQTKPQKRARSDG